MIKSPSIELQDLSPAEEKYEPFEVERSDEEPKDVSEEEATEAKTAEETEDTTAEADHSLTETYAFDNDDEDEDKTELTPEERTKPEVYDVYYCEIYLQIHCLKYP